MRLLVCGGRDYRDHENMFHVLDELHKSTPVDILINGCAQGADNLALQWANFNNITNLIHKIKIDFYPADWTQYGKSAGMQRNIQMLQVGRPDLVVAFPGGRGTAHMIQSAESYGVEVKIIEKEHDNG